MSSPTLQGDKQQPGTNVACKTCNRLFNPDRIEIHENICSKVFNKKRKVFDSAKQRIKGTELESFAPKKKMKSDGRLPAPKVNPKATEALKGIWRKKHDDFIAGIRTARQVQAHLAKGGKLADLPPPPPSENPDYIQCPHCGRRFNEAAASRHIPACATMIHNKPNKAKN